MTKIDNFVNRIIGGNCIDVMKEMPSESIDLVVTDPPYLVNYRSRDGRGFANEDNDLWLKPSFVETFRLLKDDSFCVCFFGWHKVDRFLAAWRGAGFRTFEQFVWVKDYPSSVGLTQRFHEAAYLLVKGRPPRPQVILRSVLDWKYTGDELHPTQKPVMSILPLIMAYSRKGDIVLDPFAGSGTTAVAARQLGRRYIGIEVEKEYTRIAQERLRQERRE